MQKQKYQAYAAATQTVARTKQIVMLYDGAIRFMQQAKEATVAKRIEDRYNALTKASSVVTGLQYCLDHENGGNIAKVLHNYYSTVDSRIFAIHRNDSVKECEGVIDELKKMRDIWHEIDVKESENAKANNPQHVETPTVAAPPAPVIEVDKGVTLSA